MSKNKWMKQLQSLDGAVNADQDLQVLKSPSPSLNWIFGKNGGIPLGSSAVFYGPQKSGKSLASYLYAGYIHRTDPEAMVVRFDTEMRSMFQMRGNWGIDYNRFMAFDTNNPIEIFDQISGPINAMVQEGMPLKLIIIDSLTALAGLREQDADSIAKAQMGDRAAAVTKGLKQILPIIRRNKIALIATSHLRANFDAGLYGPKEKAALSWSEKHFFEHFIEVKKDGSSEGKSDILGNKLENDAVKDFRGNKEITGHKIYVKMAENSLGVAGRSGEFTIDYTKGLINVHEEVFCLAVNNNLVERPNNRTYIFDGASFSSKADFVNAIKDNEELQAKLLQKIEKSQKTEE
jgi:RecA/RadA recombinase